MFRNNYDNDSVTFSPQGRIFQVEYAQEALKQGSVIVGLVSKTHAVLAAIKRNAEELSSYQKKIVGVDSHLGVALAGLSSDGRVLLNFMKQQALSSRLTYGRPLPVERVVAQIGERAQSSTQHYGKRPYGVGLLVAGVDDAGPHVFEFLPSGMTQEMLACALGGRSQMARTYLERHLDEFPGATRDQLIGHALRALKESLAQDKELTVENASVAVIGTGKRAEDEEDEEDDDDDDDDDDDRRGTSTAKTTGGSRIESFKLYDGPEVGPLLDASLEAETGDAQPSTTEGEGDGSGGGGEQPAAEGADGMDVDS